MLTDELIKKSAATIETFSRGLSYYRNHYVKDFTANQNTFSALVYGSDIYNVRITLNENADHISAYHCDCPASHKYIGACKHVVAVLKRIQECNLDKQPPVKKQEPSNLLFHFFQSIRQSPQNEKFAHLIPTLNIRRYYKKIAADLEFTIGSERQYVIRNMKNFLSSAYLKEDIKFGAKFTLHSVMPNFDPISAQLYNLLITAYEDEQSLSPYTISDSKVAVNKSFLLTPTSLQKFFAIMENTPFDLSFDGYLYPQTSILNDRPNLKIKLENNAYGKAVLSLGKTSILPLDHHYRYLWVNDTLYHVDKEFSTYIKPLLLAFEQSPGITLPIHTEDLPRFFSNVMPELEKIASLDVSNTIMKKYDILPLNAAIYLDQDKNSLYADLKFKYGDIEINPFLNKEIVNHTGDKILIRDQQEEDKIHALFAKYAFTPQKNHYIQSDEMQIYDFLNDGIRELTNCAEIYYSDTMKANPIKRIENLSTGIRVSDDNVLEMSFEADDLNLPDIFSMLRSYRLKKRYHRLKNGTFINLDNDELENLADLAEHLNLKAPKNSNTIKLSLAKALYLDNLSRDIEGLKLSRNQAFNQLISDITEPAKLDIAIPPSLNGILRDYQKVGFKWLKTLAHYKLGGILADDMGLGKTLQVITFILSEKSKSPLPSIVIAPTSLIYNWQEEIERFAPELTSLVITGSRAERLELLKQSNNYDIIITTYNILKRDITDYENRHFHYCFLDEAQHIKNPNTQNAKSVKHLQTDGYFALTGTPIENTLTELWSIFDFIMPDYLLSHSAFKKKFEIPIVKKQDPLVMRDLNRYITPFILRRIKSKVLTELPPKIESKLINTMTDKQAKIYQSYFIQAQKEFQTELAKNGFEQSRIKILSILTRLRQICCHPSLFLEDYHGSSGKLELMLEMLIDAIKGNHRVLIFSQFTSMLAILQNELKNRSISYYYLDGSTPALDRVQMANSFNSGNQPVFLISLKAGGTGLNLIGADMVIHYDPWWNPSVEEQATDRAYRLGQDNTVQVFKLITKNTIEEKIFNLQQKKKSLIDSIIQPGENFLSKLNEKELRELFNLT